MWELKRPPSAPSFWVSVLSFLTESWPLPAPQLPCRWQGAWPNRCANIYRQSQPPCHRIPAHLILRLLPCPFHRAASGKVWAYIPGRLSPESLKFQQVQCKHNQNIAHNEGECKTCKCQVRWGNFILYKNTCWKYTSFLDCTQFFIHTHMQF